MSQTAPVFDAELFFECQNSLGEGILWDSKKGLLHWVDLTAAQVHTLDPKTMRYCIDAYPESDFVTAIALRQHEPGFVALTQRHIVTIPQSTPTELGSSAQPTTQKSETTLSSPKFADAPGKVVRFNDGGCDPRGRMFAGTMALPESYTGTREGELWRLDLDGKVTRVLTEVGTSNGIGWSPDGKVMYYVDSADDEVSAFDYDVNAGGMSNRRVFASTPPPIDPSTPTAGVFDGLTMDGEGNVWVARWRDQRVIGYKPSGEIICHIRCIGCKSPTIPCFGGESLDVMYIASAHTTHANEGDIQSAVPHSGDLFKIDFGAGSPVRTLLGKGWSGAERHRYGA